MGWIFEGPAADQAVGLAHEVVRAIANSEEVMILGIPAHGGHMLTPDAVCVEFPKRQQSAFPFLVRIAGIFPVPADGGGEQQKDGWAPAHKTDLKSWATSS